MLVEKPLGEMGVHRIEFETVKLTARFNVFCQSTKMLKRVEADLEDIRLSPRFQIQTSPCDVQLTHPKAHANFRLLQPVFQAVKVMM